MTKLIFDLEKTLIQLFKINDQLEALELNYNEDLICTLKDEFIRKYRLILTPDQIDYIYKI